MDRLNWPHDFMNKIICEDCLGSMKKIPENSIDCIITSPPYFGLRDYGIRQIIGGDPGCKHEWGDPQPPRGHKSGKPGPNAIPGATNIAKDAARRGPGHSTCQKCEAWRGQLGLEPSPEMYIEHLLGIFKEAKRILKPWGVFWLNIGDTYFGSGCGTNDYRTALSISISRPKLYDGPRPQNLRKHPTLKPLDLIGIPWMLAFALRADGWYIRMDCIWSKGSAMPESVNGWRWERHRIKIGNLGRGKHKWSAHTGQKDSPVSSSIDSIWQDCHGCEKCLPNDGLVLRKGNWRPTRAHEYIFLLAKTDNYFSDAEAAREPAAYDGRKDTFFKGCQKYKNGFSPIQNIETFWARGHERWPSQDEDGNRFRNPRSVWHINPKPFKDAHFATFPPDLVKRCLEASISKKGVCPKCGAPWIRIVKTERENKSWWALSGKNINDVKDQGKYGGRNQGGGEFFNRKRKDYDIRLGPTVKSQTLGWKASCTCNAGEPIPATVLDPFAGAGTVGIVAKQLGINYILIDIKPEYCDMSRKRIAKEVQQLKI